MPAAFPPLTPLCIRAPLFSSGSPSNDCCNPPIFRFSLRISPITMQLAQQTDYAIRTLIYTAFHADRLVNITEIAEFYAISRSHLTKIVAFLSELGYLKSIRGKGGGLKL